MDLKGIGTSDMPIVISDDEDEAMVRQLIDPSTDHHHTFYDLTLDDDEEEGAIVPYEPPNQPPSPFKGLSAFHPSDTEAASLGKRKRGPWVVHESQSNFAPISYPRAKSPGAPPNESKKARKRRRRMERQFAEVQQGLGGGVGQIGPNILTATSMASLPMPPPPFGMPMNWSNLNPPYLHHQQPPQSFPHHHIPHPFNHNPPPPIQNLQHNHLPPNFQYNQLEPPPQLPFPDFASHVPQSSSTEHNTGANGANATTPPVSHQPMLELAQSWQNLGRASISSDSTGPPPNSGQSWASMSTDIPITSSPEFGDSFIPLDLPTASKLPPTKPRPRAQPPPISLPTASSSSLRVDAPQFIPAQKKPLLPPLQPNLPLRPGTSSTSRVPIPVESVPSSAMSIEPPTPTKPTGPATATSPESPSNEKSPAQTIGMPPQSDPHSKHGVFLVTLSSSKKWLRSSGSSSSVHVPNPARTLVLENIPKARRNPEFVNTWAKNVIIRHGPSSLDSSERKKLSGNNPVFVELDRKGGKALVEFSSSELARAAWGSPRLGRPPRPDEIHPKKAASASASGADGKVLPKPIRMDLIRAWWYRVHGVGADAGVGELEEGEIEGDDAVMAVAAPSSSSSGPVPKEQKNKSTRIGEEDRQGRAKVAVKPYRGDEPGPSGNLMYGVGLASYQSMPNHLFIRYRGPPPETIAPLPEPLVAPTPLPIPITPSQAPASSSVPVPVRPIKELPRGPSFKARQRELEERLAKSRLESSVDLVPATTATVPSSPAVVPTPPPPAPTPVPVTPPVSETTNQAQEMSQEERLAMEDRLRKLVLMSKRKPKPPPVAEVAPLPVPIIPSPTPPVLPPVTETPSLQPRPSVPTTPSLDDLAVSFITETLQTTQAIPMPTPKQEDLATKQKRLEAHIAECKDLMSRIASASSKAEKDGLMVQLREKSRLMKESTTTAKMTAESATVKTVVVRWPESRHDAGLIDISDDEDEDEDAMDLDDSTMD